jgi:hypothetical protein
MPMYFGVGALAAAVLARREATPAARATTAAAALLAWPLWAPIALSREPPARGPSTRGPEARILRALEEALEAVRGTPLATLLPQRSVEAMRASVARASQRVGELEAAVALPSHDPERARRRLEGLEAEGASSRTLATARVHLDNIERLARLLSRERRALDELADLCDALRSQLVLARYAGSNLHGIGDTVDEVAARVDGLDGVFHLEETEAPP